MSSFKLYFLPLSITFLATQVAFAETWPSPIPCGDAGFGECIKPIADYATNIALIVAVVIIVWAGFKFVVSQGSEEKITSARKTLLWAVTGLAIVIMAKALAYAFQNFFTGL